MMTSIACAARTDILMMDMRWVSITTVIGIAKDVLFVLPLLG